MSSGLLGNNRTAHEERIISVQPSLRHAVEVLLQGVIQVWFSTDTTPRRRRRSSPVGAS